MQGMLLKLLGVSTTSSRIIVFPTMRFSCIIQQSTNPIYTPDPGEILNPLILLYHEI